MLFDTSHSLLHMTAMQMSVVGAVLLSQKNYEIFHPIVLILQVMTSPYAEDNIVCVSP